MSCNGCIYLIGKDATCNQSYFCNTSPSFKREKEFVKDKALLRKSTRSKVKIEGSDPVTGLTQEGD
jgi:hypothetical protein